MKHGNTSTIEEDKPAVIKINRANIYDETVIAHELIHYYDHVLLLLGSTWRDMVLLSLYDRLGSKVPHCNDVISRCVNWLAQDEVNRIGGIHPPLFLLKSFDIDLKMGKPLGTVFGYGRTEEIRECIAHFEAQAKRT